MEKEIIQAKLSDQFNKAHKLYESFLQDEKCDEAHYTEAINILNTVKDMVTTQGLFSPNEDFTEIKTEHLKYLFLPYYLGDIYGRSMTDRKDKVQKAIEYHTEFLKLMHHYGNLSKSQVEALSHVKQGVNPTEKVAPAEARTQLIQRHQTKKALQEELKLLKGSTDDSKIREYYLKLIEFYVISAFEAISMNMKELDAIKFLETHTLKPAPAPEEKKAKPEIYTIPGPIPTAPIMSSAGTIPVQEFVDKRWQYQKDTLKPGYPLPTMSLEEYGEFEKQRMIANTE